MNDEISPNIAVQLGAELQSMTGRPVRMVQTHISWVLLDGEFAWKLKKPVHLDFLDFSTLERRKECCEDELRLNRRFAPDLYLDVVAIRGTVDRPVLGGTGQVIDYAVRMKQFADGALFEERLALSQLSAADVTMLGRDMAAIHGAAPPVDANSPYGTPTSIEATTRNLIGSMRAIDQDVRIEQAQRWLEDQAEALRHFWVQRRSGGRVRECHGDLHLGNAVMWQGRAQGFDCIEFDASLRWIDTINDIAFMVMDLVAHDRRDLAFAFLNAYLEQGGDYLGLPGLRYYCVYRALVRALVARVRTPRTSARAGPDYLATALEFAQGHDPRLLITHGLSGSGKTYASSQIAQHTAAVRIRSDVERKRMHGLGALDASAVGIEHGIYSERDTRQTYQRLHDLADMSLQAGYRTIVDASFLEASDRSGFHDLARSHHAAFRILACVADAEVLRHRVAARRLEASDASEADLGVLERQLAAWQPLGADELRYTVQANTAAASAGAESTSSPWIDPWAAGVNTMVPTAP